MFKKLFRTAVATGVAALGVKVVKDIIDADEEEKRIVELEPEEKENQEEE